jgi:phosphoglycolate phosphatase
VVGFDLDLTLVDSADGIVATFVHACEGVGVDVSPDAMRPLIGLPLDETMRHFLPSEAIVDAVRLYREAYMSIGVPAAKNLPGAPAALAAVGRRGGRALVVTAKPESAARALLDHVGLAVDGVIGDRYGAAKGVALEEQGAIAHVGDHPGDMTGARSAGICAVGVTTGSHDAVALREAGADVVLPNLLDFPDWLDGFLRS